MTYHYYILEARFFLECSKTNFWVITKSFILKARNIDKYKKMTTKFIQKNSKTIK